MSNEGKSALSGSAVLERYMFEEVLPRQLGDIYPYLQQPDVQEVMINDPHNVWLERGGRYEKLPLAFDAGRLTSVITTIANLNQAGGLGGQAKILNCKLPGLRIAATLEPISHLGPSLCIRRHASKIIDLQEYVDTGAFDPVWPAAKTGGQLSLSKPEKQDIAKGGAALAQMLMYIMQERFNSIVCGSTSSGKTTLLNALARVIPDSERVLTIEQPHELQIKAPNWVGFEANEALGVSIRDLVRHALRYRPNRIMVGEVRGAEAFDVLDAYNTGHPGSGFSMHSDSALTGLYRFENMVRMAPEAANWPLLDLRRQIAATFHFVIHASTYEGARGPSELVQVLGLDDKGEYRIETLFKKSHPH